MGRRATSRDFWGDAQIAWLLALVLAAAWSWRDWSDLTALRLPDTDDVMRLQQVRDWLGGQAFSDMSQHRLGIGLPMHWSRLADLAPAALIGLFSPIVGRHAAEVVAVIAWPTLLFAAALTITASIARTLGGTSVARTALVVAAIAYPATTLFMPGRIDHHGFQIVLALGIVRLLLKRPRMGSGFLIGMLSVASLVIGMETLPFLLIAGALMLVEWLRGEEERMRGYAVALVLGLGLARLVFATEQWDFDGCDGFTRIAWRAASVAACVPVVLTLAGSRLRGIPMRGTLAAIAGAAGFAALFTAAPQCFSPYGNVDPLLARLWLAHVGEARPLFHAPIGVAIGYAGVLAAGIAAGVWRLLRTREWGWAVLLAFQLASLALTVTQLRGAYLGAILAAPALAAAIAAARAQGSGWLVGAWLASAGMLYPLAADALAAAPARNKLARPAEDSCTSSPALRMLASLPRGRILSPVDLGAYALAETTHDVVAAPYHRNNAGNSAMYRFFLGNPEQAAKIARVWRVDYVVLCADSFDELGMTVATDRTHMIGLLRAAEPPYWLRRVQTGRENPMVFATDRLSDSGTRR
ncbi:hypothetical protein BH09PSE4_BH09PSE4_22900 [soil metagenome]